MLDERRNAEAIEQLEEAADRERTNPTIRVLLARAYERTERLPEALESWHQALFLAPGSAAARAGIQRFIRRHPGVSVPPPASEPEPSQDPPQGNGEQAHATPAAAEALGEANLDQLIRQLEGARIVPDPDFDAIDFEVPEDEDEAFVSETLARIYAAQHQYDEAAQVYELLAEQQPERASEFLSRAQEMRQRGE